MSSNFTSKSKQNISFNTDNNFLNINIKPEPEDSKSEILQITDEDFYCRICFKIFQYHDNKNDIDNGITSTLRDLIQFGLKLSTGSQVMCDECSSLITSFYNFKNEIIDKQAKFAQLVLKNRHQSAIEIQKISNKTHEFDQLQCSEVFVKQEPLYDISDFQNNDENDSQDFNNDSDFRTAPRYPNKKGRRKKIIENEIYETPKRAYVKRKDPEKCDVCGKEVINLINHKIKKHDYKHLFKCPSCDYSTYEKKDLQIHSQSKHSKKLKSLEQDSSQVCPHCAKQVRFLDMHIANIHLGEKNYFCDFCSFSSYRKQSMEHHILNNHLPKSVKCSQCNFTTISQDRLRNHIKNQHEARPPPTEFICSAPECSKVFRRKIQLQFHVRRRHEKEMAYPCLAPGCSKSFFSKAEQQVHFQNSHGPKNVVCDECGKAFSSVAMLKKHNTLHQEYRYPCTYCGLKYRNSAQLKNHLNRVHLNKRDHVCETCGADFFLARDLERHIKTKH